MNSSFVVCLAACLVAVVVSQGTPSNTGASSGRMANPMAALGMPNMMGMGMPRGGGGSGGMNMFSRLMPLMAATGNTGGDAMADLFLMQAMCPRGNMLFCMMAMRQ